MQQQHTIPLEVLTALRQFQWSEILAKGRLLEDLNDRQWRFIKGLVVELIVEKHSSGLRYVGLDHKDYDWPEFGLSVELKSGFSGSMYGRRGKLNNSFNIKFNNSNGTNKMDKLSPDQVADLLLVVKNNGAFVVDKATVLRCSKKGGDGFDVILNKNDVIEITGLVNPPVYQDINLKEMITNAIKQVI